MILIAASALLFGCGDKKSYTIKGNVAGIEGTVVLLDSNFTEINTAEAKDGKFTMQGEVVVPGMYTLAVNDEDFAYVIIEGGTIKVTGRFDPNGESLFEDVRLSGTPSNDGYTRFIDSENAIYDKIDIENINEEILENLSKELMELMHSTFEKNKDNYVSVLMVQSLFMNDETSETILSMISRIPEKYAADETIVQIKGVAEQMAKTEPGQQYIDITLPDFEGNAVSLSDHVGEGKYVLLDFWASWCGPCMVEVPFLVEAYSKYNAMGFEIFGVGLNDRAENLTQAINENEMNWIHVIGSMNDQAPKDYAIKSIPANFLIGPDGAIIAKNLRGKELMTKLAEIFGEI